MRRLVSHGTLFVIMVIGMGSLGTMGSFALFGSAAGGQGATFTAGTVILERSAQDVCTVTGLAPGDSGTCTYALTYAGSLNAWVALDVTASSLAIAVHTPQGAQTSDGGEALLGDGDDQHAMAVSLADTMGSALAPATMACPEADSRASGAAEGTGTLGSSTSCNGQLDNQLLLNGSNAGDTGSSKRPDGSWAPGQTDTVTVDWSVPRSMSDSYQGATARIELVAHAMAAANDPLVNGQPETGWVNPAGSQGSGGARGPANLVLSSASHDFGVALVGGNPVSTTFNVKNTGNATFGAPGAQIIGTGASDFTIANSTCNAAIAAGGTCAITVDFTPAVAGLSGGVPAYGTDDVAATLSLSWSLGGNTNAALSGNAQWGCTTKRTLSSCTMGYFVAPNGSDFAGANLSGIDLSGATLYFADLSGANLQYARLPSATLTGANLTNANLDAADVHSAMLDGVTWSNTVCPDGINSNHQGGTCVGTQKSKQAQQANLVLSSASHDFGVALVGGSPVSTTFNLKNIGNAISGVPVAQITGASDFTIANSTCDAAIAVGGTCAITVEFTPAVAGLSGGVPAYGTDDVAAALSLSWGQGATTSAALTGNAQWGCTTTIISSPHAPVLLSNCTMGNFVAPNGSDFAGANLSGIDLSGATLYFADLSGANLQYARLPSATLTGANLTNANLDAADVQSAMLDGVTWSNTVCPDGINSNHQGGTCVGTHKAQQANLVLSSASHDFGVALVGGSPVSTTFNLKNIGNAISGVPVAQITGASDFTIANSTCDAAIGVGGTCAITVEFTPAVAGLSGGVPAYGTDDVAAALSLSWGQGATTSAALTGNAQWGCTTTRITSLPHAPRTSSNCTMGNFVAPNGSDFAGANLSGIDLSGATLYFADLSGANLQYARLQNANLTGANLTNANLDAADVQSAILSGVTWSNTVCPDGINSDHLGGTCTSVHKAN